MAVAVGLPRFQTVGLFICNRHLRLIFKEKRLFWLSFGNSSPLPAGAVEKAAHLRALGKQRKSLESHNPLQEPTSNIFNPPARTSHSRLFLRAVMVLCKGPRELQTKELQNSRILGQRPNIRCLFLKMNLKNHCPNRFLLEFQMEIRQSGTRVY